MQPLCGAGFDAGTNAARIADRDAHRHSEERRLGHCRAGDSALKSAPAGADTVWAQPAASAVGPGEDEIAQLAELLNRAAAVTLLCGSGCATAATPQRHDDVVALADALAAPVVHALRRKEHLEWDNPFDVGMTGLIGCSSGYHAMLSCDTLVMLGTDFHYRHFYPARARAVQMDRRPEALGRRTRLDRALVGDVRSTIKALLPRLSGAKDRRFLDAAKRHYAAARAGLDDLAIPRPGDKRIHPQ